MFVLLLLSGLAFIAAVAAETADEEPSPINVKSLSLYVIAITVTTILLWLVRPEGEEKFLNGKKLMTVLKGIPVFGNALDFLPQNILNTLYTYPSRYGDHIVFYAMFQKCYSISNPVTAREVLMKRPKQFCRQTLMEYATERIGILQSVFMARGTIWSQQRRNISPAFNHKNVREYEQDIHEVIRRWIRSLQSRSSLTSKDLEPIDMLREPFNLTVNVVNQVVFGVHPDHSNAAYFYSPQLIDDLLIQFRYVMDTIFHPFPFWTIPYFSSLATLEKQAIAAADRFKQNTMPIIQYKKAAAMTQKAASTADQGSSKSDSYKTSMIDHLIVRDHLSAENASKATAELVDNDEILANVRIIYFGGIDTTAVAISWICFHLAIFPQWISILRQEIEGALETSGALKGRKEHATDSKSIDTNLWFERLGSVTFDTFETKLPFCQAFIKENLRRKGPVSGYIHNLEKDVSSFVCSNGFTIEASHGFININLEGIHHHAEYYEHPWYFRPERWVNKDSVSAEWLEKVTKKYEKDESQEETFDLVDKSLYGNTTVSSISRQHCSSTQQLLRMEESFIPFGYGPRVCPGNKMSLVEQLITLVYLVMFFDIELGCDKQEIQRLCSVTSPPNKMPILLNPRR